MVSRSGGGTTDGDDPATVNVNFRASAELVEAMDRLVASKRHSSRADVMRTALTRYLALSEQGEISSAIQRGEYDEVLEERLRFIFSKLTQPK